MKLKFSKRQCMLLFIYNFGHFFCGILHSLQAPFFPNEADKKGVPPSQYGLVFGIFYLTVFFTSPLCSKLIDHIGPVLTSYMGLFIAGITSILFGVLDKINSSALFLAFALIIRIIEAIGTTAFRTAGLSIVVTEFPDNRATAFSTLQSSIGMGIIVGPTVGGALYEWKGYLTPFLLTGVLLLMAAAASAILLSRTEEPAHCKQSRKGFLLLLKQPEILLGIAAIFGAYSNISFYQTILEPHLRRFQLSPFKVGVMFIINGAAHSILAPLCGVLCDKLIPSQYIWSFGTILVSIALLLLGPAPYFSYNLNIWICIAALIIHGVGQAAEIVSAFHCFSKVALKIGFPDNVNTYGIISALFAASSSFGGFVAPSVGGFLYEKIGFPWAAHVLIGFHILILILTMLYNFLSPKNNFPKQNEKMVNNAEKKSLVSNGVKYSNGVIISNGVLPNYKSNTNEDK